MSEPQRRTYRVWCNVPHHKDIEATSEAEAREIMSETAFKDLESGWHEDDVVGFEMQDDYELLEEGA